MATGKATPPTTTPQPPSTARQSAGDRQPVVHLEVETKLEVAPDAVLPDPLQHKAVRKVGLTELAAPVVHTLDATYYDTDHLDLLRSRVTLRRRTGGDDAGWHLKLPAGGSGVAGARSEVQLPLGSGTRVPLQLDQLVRGTARGRELKPVARLQNRRTVHRLLDADGNQAVEIADDAVTATRQGSDSVDRWREVEVELIGGTAVQLEATVKALIDAGARPAGNASKLARALPLPAASPTKGRSAGAAILTALGRHRDKLIVTERALRDRTGRLDGAATVHDARACARRIRSVLRVFEALFTDELALGLRDALQDFGRTLSAARDIEVRSRLAAGLVEELEELVGSAGTLIDAELDRRSAAAHAGIREHLDSAGHLQLLRDLDAFLDDPPLTRRAALPATSELPVQLGRSWRRLRAKADAALADPTNTGALHAVRKAAKTVRYAAESTIAVFGDEAVLFAAVLEEVQQVLGEFQDAQVSARLLVELAAHPDTDGPAGFVFGRLHAVEQAIAIGAIDDFADAWDRVEDAELATTLGMG